MRTVKKYYGFLPITLLVIAVLILISLNAGRERNFTFIEKMLIEGLAPFHKVIMASKTAIIDTWNSYIYLINVKEENEALKKTISSLKEHNNQYKEAVRTNIRLRKLLSFKEEVAAPVLPAEVASWDPSAWFQSVIIDKGTIDEIERNMPVVNSDGVIGRIIQTSYNYSKVLLIIDPNSVIDAIVQRTRTRCILGGRSDGICELKYFLTNEDVRVGDRIITSGLRGVFPKGLVLGEVTQVRKKNSEIFQHVEVSPTVDFSKLEEVLVILQKTQFQYIL